MKSINTGMIIIGGGLIKHHICNANLMVSKVSFRARCKASGLTVSLEFFFQRNGADFSVFLNTASEFDGSDSGARPDEAISWGKIRKEAEPAKVFCQKKCISSSLNNKIFVFQIYAEASLVFPLLVAETFAKDHFRRKEEEKEKK